MKRTTSHRRRTAKPVQSRAGFSMVELLMVILIISIIAAIAIPTITGVMRSARRKEVGAELSRIETSIASFKTEFSLEPWSEIKVTEDSSVTSWNADAALTLSKTRLRRLFPQFTFSGQIDFNGDGLFTGDSGSDATLTLTGPECLVFFLGGMGVRDANNDKVLDATEAASPPTLIGFSKNPFNPFNRTGDNRNGPFFNFDAARLVDKDGDGMFEYMDSLAGQTTPLHFASANNGQGYSTTQAIYVGKDGKTPLAKDSHQIISPGEDFEFGFTTNSSARGTWYDGVDLSGNRSQERDNFASFKPGGNRLGD